MAAGLGPRAGKPMTAADVVIMLGAAATGGLMNAMAGGGTIITFPALVFLGQPAITANATSTVALLPGMAASMAGYGKEVATHKEWLKTLLLPSVIGGGIGSVLLLRTPEKVFANLAPLLVLFATLLFIWQGFLARRRQPPSFTGAAASGAPQTIAAASGDSQTIAAAASGQPAAAHLPPAAAGDGAPSLRLSRTRWAWAILFQFGVSIYGGYFGAAIGILMLAVLGFLGLTNIFAMNGLKNFFGLCINGVAAAYFILRGAVVWPVALLMMAGSIAGGYGGARLAQVIGKEKARAAVVIIGFVVTALLFWQRFRS
ncbi:MAG TPA: sulfite exporter TauE/SafE family protein [Thermoanaerobaculia bacterium]|nr:sulfite exporter TauE/SafE family protein [Thermoanaerobaculia bacterium]